MPTLTLTLTLARHERRHEERAQGDTAGEGAQEGGGGGAHPQGERRDEGEIMTSRPKPLAATEPRWYPLVAASATYGCLCHVWSQARLNAEKNKNDPPGKMDEGLTLNPQP